MHQNMHFNAKNSQLSLILQINSELVLRERRGESGDRSRCIVRRAISRTFVREKGYFSGEGTNKLKKGIKNVKLISNPS